mmetsp:Transcript_23047/g.67075  ORF Transcript_23047/g.67075 Transcript_23047/m.67075 type:complete len:226 (-) Transcript_23047:1413-2090(-)
MVHGPQSRKRSHVYGGQLCFLGFIVPTTNVLAGHHRDGICLLHSRGGVLEIELGHSSLELLHGQKTGAPESPRGRIVLAHGLQKTRTISYNDVAVCTEGPSIVLAAVTTAFGDTAIDPPPGLWVLLPPLVTSPTHSSDVVAVRSHIQIGAIWRAIPALHSHVGSRVRQIRTPGAVGDNRRRFWVFRFPPSLPSGLLQLHYGRGFGMLVSAVVCSALTVELCREAR